MSEFQGLPSQVMTNGPLSLEYLLGAGPPIVRLSAFGSDNLFADIPTSVSTPMGSFLFRGGHRLWCAPEAMPRTYVPDNDGVSVEKVADGIQLHGISRPGEGIAKTIQIQLLHEETRITLTHSLRNENPWPVELAAWTLTMFRLDGWVILPQPTGNVDPDGLLSNRILALWPYTQINDPRLVLRDEFILLRAMPGRSPLKVGYFNPHGGMAYWLNGILFRKVYETGPGRYHPDGGCNAESCCNDQFVELESLGPLVRLEPGSVINLIETWELYPGLNVPFLSGDISELVQSG